jgi:hypothetical protein
MSKGNPLRIVLRRMVLVMPQLHTFFNKVRGLESQGMLMDEFNCQRMF